MRKAHDKTKQIKKERKYQGAKVHATARRKGIYHNIRSSYT